jgi:hypothetical protein
MMDFHHQSRIKKQENGVMLIENGKTIIAITGSGFATLAFVDGIAVIPVYCDFISGGKVYKAESWSHMTNYVGFNFSSSAEPEKIVFYPSNDTGNASKRIEINCK